MLKVAGELYKLFSSEKVELNLLLRVSDPPFILQSGTPYLHSSIASVCCLIAVVDSLPLSVGGPALSVGSGGSCPRRFSWAKGLHLPVLSSVGRDGFPTRSGLDGRPVVCPSVRLSHVLP